MPEKNKPAYASLHLRAAPVTDHFPDGRSACAVGLPRYKNSYDAPLAPGEPHSKCSDGDSHTLYDHTQPFRGEQRTCPHPLRRPRRRAAAAGALPGDADEHLPLLPAGADAVQRSAAKVAPMAPHRPHDADRLRPQRGDRVRAVPLRPRHGGDGRRDLQHAGDVRRRNIAAAGPRP